MQMLRIHRRSRRPSNVHLFRLLALPHILIFISIRPLDALVVPGVDDLAVRARSAESRAGVAAATALSPLALSRASRRSSGDRDSSGGDEGSGRESRGSGLAAALSGGGNSAARVRGG